MVGEDGVRVVRQEGGERVVPCNTEKSNRVVIRGRGGAEDQLWHDNQGASAMLVKQHDIEL